jgi:uncharacterized membrane protein
VVLHRTCGLVSGGRSSARPTHGDPSLRLPQPKTHDTQPTMTSVVGRLHILVVHFPIALVITVAVLAVFGLSRRRPVTGLVLWVHLATLSAFITSALGLIWFDALEVSGSALALLELHRTLGLIGTALCLVASILFKRKGDRSTIGTLFLVAAAATLGTGAHQGGLSVHGDDFYDTSVKVVEPTMPAVAKVDYQTQIRPLLRNYCLRCHGHKRQKGGLRLDSEQAAMTGGETGVVIIPGDASASPMVQRIYLPADHEDTMPNKGSRPGPDQKQLIRDWIDEGAKWN